jgi:rhodanese-related sulfurtransferase
MKNLILLFMFSIGFLTISCQTNSQKNNEGKKSDNANSKTKVISEVLAPEEFIAKLQSSNGGQLVDVRTPEELNEGKIENAQNIDFYANDFKSKIEALDKSKPVFVYCRSGGRSAKAANIFKEAGFKEIYDLQGGYMNYSSK